MEARKLRFVALAPDGTVYEQTRMLKISENAIGSIKRSLLSFCDQVRAPRGTKVTYGDMTEDYFTGYETESEVLEASLAWFERERYDGLTYGGYENGGGYISRATAV